MIFQNVGQHWVSGQERRGPFQEGTSPACRQKPLGKAARVASKRDCKWQWVRERTMARAWMALMLVVGLAAMAHVAHRRLSYEEIVAKALRIFNQGRRGRSLFSLVEAIPPADSVSVHGPRPGNWVTALRVASGRECRVQVQRTLVNISCYYCSNAFPASR